METHAINPYFEERILGGDAPMTPTSTAGDVDVQKAERKLAESTLSEEREDLKEATEHSNNVILHLNLDGTVRWVSSSWEDVIGYPREEIVGKPISTIVPDDEGMFDRAVTTMTTDDSRSFRLRFSVRMGPKSRVAEIMPEAIKEIEVEVEEDKKVQEQRLNLEAQGILIYDRETGETSHTMWVIRPFVSFATVTVNLPSVLVESLGVGATILAQYIKTLAENGLSDPQNNPPPVPVLCRICERQIPPWWFEKHSELCFLEHKAESEVQLCQENLGIHRGVIVKILDAMERQSSRVPGNGGEGSRSPMVLPEYRGHPIGPQPSPSAGINNSPHTPPRSRESSASGSGFRSSKDFRVRRPQVRIVELLLDLCDTAMEISTPMIKEAFGTVEIGFRTQSPASEARITQVLQWQSPSNNTLDQERGLALLCEDTENVAKAKVEAVIRHRHTIEFSERIRLEFSMLVQDCIDEAVRTAALTREGLVEDPSSSEEDCEEEDETQFFPGSFGPHIPQHVLESGSDPSLRGRRHSSPMDHSSADVSPGDCTPRSQRSRVRGLVRRNSNRYANRSSAYYDNEGDMSDASGKSSLLNASTIPRTESPLSDADLSQTRLSINRDKKRSSIYQPRSRQASPARGVPISSSPLRILKPRITSLYDSVPTPITSPLLSTGDFSPAMESYHHHRRQSSVTSNDQLPRPPLSPRLPTVNPSQPRAVPPSIKDFEIIKPISKGAFGSVYLSKKKSTGDYYAIKVLKKADMIAKNQVTNVRAERAIMMVQGESDFVAKLFWTFSSKDYLFLVMEYLNGGDCAALIKALGGLPEEWAKRYLAEVILGLEHLHSRGIVHRDLKPDNLLIDGKGHLKLTDFGLSRMGLLGRQKRVRDQNDSTPDLLNQGPFLTRSKSVASSRSTSFDFPGSSPSSTPLITPDPGAQLIAPSYFSLSRENTSSSRRASNPRSEPNVEGLNNMMGSFHISDLPSGYGTPSVFRRPVDDDCQSEMSYGSNEAAGLGLHQVTSNTSGSQPASVSQQQMMPPPMALFDPEDSNRKFVGTPDYLAPETIRGSGQDEMSDWWSLGCIMFEFLYGYPPFNAETHDQVFENILARRINWPDDEDCPVSAEAKDLMNRLMCTDQTQRLGANGADEVKEHPWFADIKWESVLQEQPSFVPAPSHAEDTDYFDSRGATLTNLEEFEDQGQASPALTPGAEYTDRPHDAVPRQKRDGISKRGLVPLHIPPHVREGNRNRRLSEPMGADDFGNFAFKNLPVLEKANKDVIQRLRTEAMKNPVAQSIPNTPTEGSPTLSQKPLGRALSNASSKNGAKRPSSPSSLNTAPTSGSSRGSQPSSPLLVTFSTTDKRKPSGGSTTSAPAGITLSPISASSALIDIPRLNMAQHGSAISSTSTSPIKIQPKSSTTSHPASSLSTSPVLTQPKQLASPPAISPQGSLLQRRTTIPRARSTTVGSADGEKVPILDTLRKQNRRSQVFDMSPSSSDNEDARNSALLRVQRKRHSSRRMSNIAMDSPVFRPLDVLICEDHPVSRMVMERLLEKLDCRCMSVENGPDAIRCTMGAVKFDIILMEYKLPDPISGEDVARMIRTSDNPNARTPLVAVTGYLKDLMEPHHFDALLEKPMTLTSLTNILERFCNWRPPPSEKERLERLSPGERRESLGRMRFYGENPHGGQGSVERFVAQQRRTPLNQIFAYDDDSNADSSEHIVLSRSTTNEWEQLGTGRISPRPRVGTAPSLSNVSVSSSVQAPSIVTEESDVGTPAEEQPKLKAITKRANQLRHDSAQMLSKFWGQGKKDETSEDKDKSKDSKKDEDKKDEKPSSNSPEKDKSDSRSLKSDSKSEKSPKVSSELQAEEKDILPELGNLHLKPEVPASSSSANSSRARSRSRSPEKKMSKAKSIADFVMRKRVEGRRRGEEK